MTLNLGTGNGAHTINMGNGTGIDTISIGTGGTGVDVIAIGDSVASVAVTDADWSITSAGLGTFANLTNNGTTTLGDAVTDVTIQKGRLATSSAAGAALSLGSTYTYGEGNELRYSVTDWTGIGSNFNGMYLRAENGVAGTTKNVRGMEVYGVANNVGTGSVWGLLSYGYVKGTTAKTVGPVYGIQTELTFDASSGTNTITTEATPLLAKITGGVVDTYTKIQGAIVRAGDMDGQNRTYGNAILVEDDSNMAGTITWTRGLKLNAPSTLDIELQNAETISNATDGTIAFGTANLTNSGTVTVTSAGASALTVGANGATNPVLKVDASTGSVATGVSLTGAAAGSGATIASLSSGTDEKLLLNSKGRSEIRLNSRTDNTATSDFIGVQIKPGQGTSKTSGNVIGIEISPRLNSGVALAASGSIIGAHIDTYLKGTAVGTVNGDVRGLQVELVTDDAGTRTVDGYVAGIRIRSAFSATAITGNFVPLRIEKPEVQTNSQNYDAVLDLTSDLAGVWNDNPGTEPSTADGYLKVIVNGQARYIQLYSGAPVD
ncbi:MAG: hypothetical protein A2666_01515 [Parcubacteria group bacterium RIFCSPHIGHO2_01_FULL_47_10b]|nr:MAG: hypothetical protein A2666_01515 [Parcubacteria group bacterium RIFCSPHIGHO2_01_FULL_47_10b]